MVLYSPNVGDLPMASDISQFTNAFNGTHDIGQVTFAPPLSAPSSSSFSLTAQSGGSLGVGTYSYKFSYITGQYQTNNTLKQTGETLVSSALSITTTSSNKTVNITLPTTSLPASAIAFNIYRTSVGGSDYKLIATVKVGNASYTDTIGDASRGAQVPPSINTTGVTVAAQSFTEGGTLLAQKYLESTDNTIVQRFELVGMLFFTNGGSNSATANYTFTRAYTTTPTIISGNITSNAVPYSDTIVYPYIYNMSTTGFSVKISTASGANLGTTGQNVNMAMNFMAIGN